MNNAVETGKVYWAELHHVRIQVRPLQHSNEVDGWWICEGARTGVKTILPQSVFREPVAKSREPTAAHAENNSATSPR